MKLFSNVIRIFALGMMVVTTSQSFAAFNASGMDWNSLGNDFKIDKDQLTGSFKDTQRWKGTFCNGRSSYDAELAAKINKIDFKLQEDNTLNATLILTDIKINLDGSYKSELTFCQTVEGGFPMDIDSLQVLSKVIFTDGVNGAPPTLNVHVQSTKLGLVTFGDGLPVGLEQFFTDVVNKGLKEIWASSLGDWLDAKISDYLSKNFPQVPQN